nr:MAG TPA: exonuclease [Caudoviricetes sp.]
METWNINGRTVEFDDETHIYLVDGIIVPSVTTILKARFNDYAKVSRAVLEQASEKGTALHSAIEIYEKTGEESDLKEFKNYLFLKKHFGFKNISNELPIIYEEDGRVLFAGRLDQIIEIDGKRGINDFKRVSAPNKEKIAYQLNLYKLGYEQTYQEHINSLSFMQLREDTRKFTPLPINESATRNLLKDYFQEYQK